jgi:DNA mismatch repair protein MutL
MLIEQFKHFNSDINFSKKEKLVRCMAKQQSIKTGLTLDQKEMAVLVTNLFECNTPNITPTGKPTYIEYKGNYLEQLFER